MRLRFLAFVISGLASLTTVTIVGQTPARAADAPAAPCDRACLEGFVDQYLAAVVAHDPARLPVTGTVRFTENGQELALGDGFWNTATARGSYKLYVDDVQRGEVGYFGTMREAGVPVILALRLKIAGRKISEVETIIARTELGSLSAGKGAEDLEKSGGPRPALLEAVPIDKRVSREELIKTANMYFSGMQLNDGMGVYPFADDCNRVENGTQTTNNPTAVMPNARATPEPEGKENRYSMAWSCKKQFDSGLLHFVTRIRDRRYPVVDVERGLVFSFAFFDHSAGKYNTFKTPDGRTVTSGPTTPWTWEIAELFKVYDGKLHEIEAVLDRCPYGMGSGWSSRQDAMSDRAR
jgi:hypothetical protein